jgi:hypothetical protein
LLFVAAEAATHNAPAIAQLMTVAAVGLRFVGHGFSRAVGRYNFERLQPLEAQKSRLSDKPLWARTFAPGAKKGLTSEEMSYNTSDNLTA